LQAEVDIDHVPLYVAINAVQHDNMLNEAQAVSLDYTNKPVLVDGRITAFMGFNFIHSERTFGSPSCTQTGTVAGTYRIPAWAKTGVVLGMWNDVSSSVDKRVDKRNSWQVYVTGTFGAARLEEKQVDEIDSV